QERRLNPFPNGGWPGTFDAVHELAMFAVVGVLVGALVADDAEAGEGAAGVVDDADDADRSGAVQDHGHVDD
ncbi:MAG: hypothetical protein HKN41_07345, partial [Ilumatobacter sp.]|nr:hypothetical protein [Ilumatobacter sp.]